jgi:hypothetical protein
VTKAQGEANNIIDIADQGRPDIAALTDSDGNGLGDISIGAPGSASANVNEVKVRDYVRVDLIEPIRAEETVMRPTDDYVADFVAGILRLKVVHAYAVMQPIEAYIAANGPIPESAPRVNGGEHLINLINLAFQDNNAILVQNAGADVAVITRADLLRTVIEGTEMS